MKNARISLNRHKMWRNLVRIDITPSSITERRLNALWHPLASIARFIGENQWRLQGPHGLFDHLICAQHWLCRGRGTLGFRTKRSAAGAGLPALPR